MNAVDVEQINPFLLPSVPMENLSKLPRLAAIYFAISGSNEILYNGEIQGLPDPQDGVYYLVNMLVGTRAALEGRTDLIGPDTGPTAIRENGQVKTVVQFVKF